MTVTRRVTGLSTKNILRIIGCPHLALYRGKKYFYFVYCKDICHTLTVAVVRLCDLPLAEWIEKGRTFAKLQGYEPQAESAPDDPRKDLYGIREIAEVAGLSPSAVANWRNRYSNFPKPLVELSMGPIFSGSEVRTWINTNKGKAA